MPRPNFLVRARSMAIGRGIAGGASNLQIDQSLKLLVHNDVDVASRRWWDCVTHMEVRNWSRVMATCMAFHSLAMDQTAWHRVQSLLETDYSNRCIDQVSKHFRLHLSCSCQSKTNKLRRFGEAASVCLYFLHGRASIRFTVASIHLWSLIYQNSWHWTWGLLNWLFSHQSGHYHYHLSWK